MQLSTITGKEGSDYIHANYVDGYNASNAFILTQGECLKMAVQVQYLVLSVEP